MLLKFRLLQIEPEKRLETLMYQFSLYNKTLKGMPFNKLDSLNNGLNTKVPYEIFIELSDNVSMTFNSLKH